MKRLQRTQQFLARCCAEQRRGFDAAELASLMGASRHNISADCNELWRAGVVVKVSGRPVLFWDREVYHRLHPTGPAPMAPAHPGATPHTMAVAQPPVPDDPLSGLIGANESLRRQVEQAKAAVLYPPAGLHTLVVGPTGVGKSHMAELMHGFAIATGKLPPAAPFVTLNCADYASNPQLLMAHLFGAVRGAYTGAERDREGLVEQADGGMLFLDEVHRLPADGQEMLFRLIDKGLYRRLGEAGAERRARVMLIAATTERVDSSLLRTFTRRIPMVIELPPLAERTVGERLRFIRRFLRTEATKIGVDILVPQESLRMLLEYECLGNIGQLGNDIQLACARLFLRYLAQRQEPMELSPAHLPEHIHRTIPPARHRSHEVADLIDGLGGRLEVTRRPDTRPEADAESNPLSFYGLIERQMRDLQRQGLSLTQAEQVIQKNISGHFQDFVDQVRRRHQNQRQELSKLVGHEVLRAAERGLLWAEERLGRAQPERALYALALHIHASVERVRTGRTQDYHIRLPADETPETAVAAGLVDLMGRELGCALPDSDIAFAAMLLRPDEPAPADEQVSVVVVAHGRTATAMVEVAHGLTGVDLAVAVDMPLDEEPARVKEHLIAMAEEGRFGGGLLLLVDMGSLESIGEAVAQRTGVPVRTIGMVSPPLVVEAVHHASMAGATLDQVYHAVLTARTDLLGRETTEGLPYVVLAFCFTGAGSALTLARMVTEALGRQSRRVEVIPASIGRGAGWNRLVATLLRSHRLLVTVGPVNPRIPGVPYISTEEMVVGQGAPRLRHLVEEGTGARDEVAPAAAQTSDDTSIFLHMAASLGDYLKVTNPAATVPMVVKGLQSIEQYLGRPLAPELRVGVAMHLVCLLERKVQDRLLRDAGPAAAAPAHRGNLPWLSAALQEITGIFHVQLTTDELERLDEVISESVSAQSEVSS